MPSESTGIFGSETWLSIAKSIATAAVSAVILIYSVSNGISARIDELTKDINKDISEIREDIVDSRHAVPEWIVKSIDRNMDAIEANGDKIDKLTDKITDRYPAGVRGWDCGPQDQ